MRSMFSNHEGESSINLIKLSGACRICNPAMIKGVAMAFKGDRVSVVVVAAGKGSRMKTEINKMFLEIREIPVLYRTLHRLNQIELIDSIILVCQPAERDQIEYMIRKHEPISKITALVDGGKERFQSVCNGLVKAIKQSERGLTMVHDGARPFITDNLIYRLLTSVEKENIVIPSLTATETIRWKHKNGQLSVLNRDQLYLIQTPQAFRTSMIPTCFFESYPEIEKFTDEASFFEAAGKKVSMVEGEKWNIKLTTPEDIHWADCLLAHYQQLRLAGLEN